MKKNVSFVLLLCAALIGAGVWYQWSRSSGPKASGSFVVSDHPGTLRCSSSPPREAQISEIGGKIRVTLKLGEASALGAHLKTDGGAEFDAEPKWFVCFDDMDVLHYGIYPKRVNRIEEKEGSLAIRTLPEAERGKVFAEVAKALGW